MFPRNLFDGTSSPNENLAWIADFLGTDLLNILAWTLVPVYAIMMAASCRYRRGFTWEYALPPALAASFALLVACQPNLTVRGESSFVLAFSILASAGLTVITLGVVIVRCGQTLNWTPELHPFAPLSLGVNILTAPLWATIALTLSQNAVRGAWERQVQQVHGVILWSAAGLALCAIVWRFVYHRGRSVKPLLKEEKPAPVTLTTTKEKPAPKAETASTEPAETTTSA
jgi:hypothetical protein